MRTEIRLRGLPDAVELRSHAQRQLNFHLSRFSGALDEVMLRATDVNGPKGGLDKRCQILARLKRGGSVTISVSSPDARGAIDHAAERMVRMIARELARSRTWGAIG
jgi:ribosome-associated translation inhibitor RaiA